jgi:hypothetical protein
MKLSLFLLVGFFWLAACDNRETELQNRLDKLQKQVADLSEAQTRRVGDSDLGRLYVLADMERKGQSIGWLYSARTINTGEVSRVGDDLWNVRAVQAFTDLKAPVAPIPKAKEGGPFYELRYTVLLVQFAGKAQTVP